MPIGCNREFVLSKPIQPFDNGRCSTQSALMNISDLSVADLRRVVGIKEQIAGLEAELAALVGDATPEAVEPSLRRRRRMSAAARRKIAIAQKARWDKVRASKIILPAPALKRKRRMSAAVRAAISAAAKARWAKFHATK